jgi:hypothetical protein
MKNDDLFFSLIISIVQSHAHKLFFSDHSQVQIHLFFFYFFKSGIKCGDKLILLFYRINLGKSTETC